MMGSMRIATAALLVLTATAVSAHAPAKHEAAAISVPQSAQAAAATVDAFHGALRRGDTKTAASLLAADALVFEEGGVERSKAEYVERHLPADAAFSQVVASTITRRSGGSDGALAWIASEGRMTGTYKGKAVDRVTTETMVLRRVGPTWKVVHIHWSSAAAHD